MLPGIRRGKRHKKKNRRAAFLPAAQLPSACLSTGSPCAFFASPQPIVSVMCYENNILCCFPAQETLYCVRALLSIRFLVIFPVTFHERAETPCHALQKKNRAVFCAFLSKGAKEFLPRNPLTFPPQMTMMKVTGNCSSPPIMRERSVPFSWTATLTVTRPGTGAPPLRPPVCCAHNPPRAPFPAHPAGKD